VNSRVSAERATARLHITLNEMADCYLVCQVVLGDRLSLPLLVENWGEPVVFPGGERGDLVL